MKVKITENTLEKVLCSIDFPEEKNIIEAHYIDFLIRLSERYLEGKLTKVLDIPCGVGRHHKIFKRARL